MNNEWSLRTSDASIAFIFGLCSLFQSESMDYGTHSVVFSGGDRPPNLGGGGHLRGKLIFLGGKIEFLKKVATQEIRPPPLKMGAIFLKNSFMYARIH
jgi:hypothetical protein